MADYDPFDIDGNARRKGLDEALDRLRKKQHEEDFIWLLSGQRGRRIVWELLSNCGVFRGSFTGNSETFFREGMRAIGLRYLEMVKDVAPESFSDMMQEAKDNERKFRAALDGNTTSGNESSTRSDPN